jgi:ADP-heptose:LPS heptosyltransferase
MKIDLLIDLGLFMRIPSVIAFLSGAKRTAGFHRYELEGLYRGSHYDCPVAFNQNTHMAKNFLALALTALQQGSDHPNLKRAVDLREFTVPRHRSDSRVRSIVRRKLQEACPDYEAQSLILVCPDVGKNLSVRNYPRELYAKAIGSILAQRPESLVILIGTPTDRETCRWIAGQVGHRQCVDFSGQTATLAELLELMHLSSLLIGNDNGPLHLASLTPCRILALFSTDSPFIYGPLGNCVILYQFYQCSPCISAYNHKHSRCHNNRCLQTLPPDLVSDYALRLLKDELVPHTCNNAVPYLI